MRWITFLILLYFMSALQSSYLGGLPFGHDGRGGPWPAIAYLPMLAIFYAMFAADTAAPLAALACGLMYDLNASAPVGTTMVPLALTCLLVLRVRLSIFREHVIPQMFITWLAMLVLALLESLFRLLLGAQFEGHSFWTHLWRLAGIAFYTAIISPAFFWFFFRFKQALGFTAHGPRGRA